MEQYFKSTMPGCKYVAILFDLLRTSDLWMTGCPLWVPVAGKGSMDPSVWRGVGLLPHAALINPES